MQRTQHGAQFEVGETRMDEHALVATAPMAPSTSGVVTLGDVGLSRRASSRFDLKRLLDAIAATLALLLLAPVMGVIALLIKLDSAGPVFYRAARVGYRGETLRMLKFRKMHDRATGSPLTMDDDARFTRIGGWLAKLKLDELPQLWHVLTGEMSLVGPRPETEGFVARHEAEYREILSVRPGVLGWSQLAFAEESRILDDADPVAHYVTAILPQKVSLDLLYATTRTVLLDLRIVFWSVLAVALRRRVAVHRTDGRMNLRRR
jgi:lipopolysaccharide/colanic/teichoic acid biosynthesis glycosyltransferase